MVSPPTRSQTTSTPRPFGRVERGAHDVVGRVVDGDVGAELAAQVELLGASRRRDDTGTERHAQLDRGRADATGAGVDEHRLPRLEVTALREREVRNVEREEERGGVDVVE